MHRETAMEIIRAALPEHADLLMRHLEPSVRVSVLDAPPAPANPYTSFFGGAPFLAEDIEWPRWDTKAYLTDKIARREAKFKANPRATGSRDLVAKMRLKLSRDPLPLAFLGQLFLADIHAHANLPGWPLDGTLSFFYSVSESAWGFDPLNRGHCRVIYSPAITPLVPTAPPPDLNKDSTFPHCRLTLQTDWTLPTRIDFNGGNLSVWGNDAYRALCDRLSPELGEKTKIHRCGGHPQEIQGDMRLECQLVTNGLYCGDQSTMNDPRQKVLESGAADWRLLLQIDSDPKLNWMWGDAGRIYFWARQQDIESTDFARAWAILQCY